MTGVDYRAVRSALFIDVCGANQKSRDFFDGLLRGRKPNANQVVLNKGLEAFDRKSEVRASLIADHRVDFVYDQGARCLEHSAAALTGQKNEERFGCGNDDV